jgi:hypothetical protein
MDTIIRVIRGLIDDKLLKDGLNVYIFKGIFKRFQITEPFVDPTTIQVFKNGVVLASNHWNYDIDIGFVNIDVQSGETLDTDDELEIRYHYYKKHSDEGLQCFAEASCAYFVMYKYPKSFRVEDGELCTDGGVAPTHEDECLIALIASIIAEPDITVNTPDFSFKSNDTRSIDEKISKVFRSANRAQCIIDFIDKDCD